MKSYSFANGSPPSMKEVWHFRPEDVLVRPAASMACEGIWESAVCKRLRCTSLASGNVRYKFYSYVAGSSVLERFICSDVGIYYVLYSRVYVYESLISEEWVESSSSGAIDLSCSSFPFPGSRWILFSRISVSSGSLQLSSRTLQWQRWWCSLLILKILFGRGSWWVRLGS